ncbi:tyrosine-type recombinase/integrase [Nonomuraea sp. CA-143628]|uniref:tyrosine-type recombinase/integrase n=1 Tax=Nonomuraea sp. CA-143628 TaxID=3239997 RepID=UPI003D8BB44F
MANASPTFVEQLASTMRLPRAAQVERPAASGRFRQSPRRRFAGRGRISRTSVGGVFTSGLDLPMNQWAVDRFPGLGVIVSRQKAVRYSPWLIRTLFSASFAVLQRPPSCWYGRSTSMSRAPSTWRWCPLDAHNVRRSFRRITKNAGLGTDWTPRELRHSFVSIMSDQGIPIETIADLVGHAGTSVTEAVYRRQLRPVITKGAQTMNTIFGDSQHG